VHLSSLPSARHTTQGPSWILSHGPAPQVRGTTSMRVGADAGPGARWTLHAQSWSGQMVLTKRRRGGVCRADGKDEKWTCPLFIFTVGPAHQTTSTFHFYHLPGATLHAHVSTARSRPRENRYACVCRADGKDEQWTWWCVPGRR
jgi:hypothetical protein